MRTHDILCQKHKEDILHALLDMYTHPGILQLMPAWSASCRPAMYTYPDTSQCIPIKQTGNSGHVQLVTCNKEILYPCHCLTLILSFRYYCDTLTFL